MHQQLRHDRVELAAVLFQEPSRLGVALVGDPPDFFIDGVEQTVRDSGHAGIALGGQDRERPDSLGHAPAADHGPGDACHHFKVALGTCRHDVEHLLLRGHTSERANNPAAKIVHVIAVSV